jgi:hypothetical protein
MPGAPFLFFNETVAEHGEIAGPHGLRHMQSEPQRAPMMARADEMKV